MRITFVTRKFGNVERNSHCDVLHITPVRVARLFLDCNGVFAIKAYYSQLLFEPVCTDITNYCLNYLTHNFVVIGMINRY